MQYYDGAASWHQWSALSAQTADDLVWKVAAPSPTIPFNYTPSVLPCLLLHAPASSFHFYRPHLKETRGPLTNSESWWARCGQQLASVLPGSWSGQLARKIRFGKQFCPNASKGHRKTTHWHPLSFSWNFHDLSREKRDERFLVMVIPPAAFVVHLTSVSSLPCAHVHYLCTWDRDRGLYLYELTHWCFF